MQHRINRILTLSFLLLIWSTNAAASTTGSDMPWAGPLETIQGWLTGDIAHIALIVTIAISGLTLAFGEAGGAFRRMGGIVFGISMAAGATAVASALGIAGACI